MERLGYNILKQNKATLIAAIILLWLGAMVFSFLELEALNRNSYYSDAETYYKSSSIKPEKNIDGYLYVRYLYQTRSMIGYSGAKLFLFVIFLLLGLSIIKQNSNKILLSLIIFHPFILFMFIRGMKESLMAVMFLIFVIFFKKSKILSVAFLSVGYYYLRPFGHLMVLIPYFFSFLPRKRINLKYILYGSFVLCALAPLLRDYLAQNIPYLLGMINVQSDSGYSVEYSELLGEGLVRFLLGPTPIKPVIALFSSIYEFYTPLTFLMLFSGSIVSLIIILRLIKEKVRASRLGLFSLALATGHALTYILIQDGMVDTRQRAMYYLFLIGFYINAETHNNIQ